MLQRFEVSQRDQRTFARLRLVAGVLAFAAGVLILLSDAPLAVTLIGLVGVLVPLAWLKQARRAHARAAAPERYALTIHARGFVLDEGDAQTLVRWTEVHAIEVDEERLDVVVWLKNQHAVRVEPRYEGVEIHTLMLTLRKAQAGALLPLALAAAESDARQM